MATKKGKPEVEFKRVIQVSLFPELVEEIKLFSLKRAEVLDRMESLSAKGYAFSIKPNFKPEGFSCSVMPAYADLPNAGYMIYGNGPTPITAIAVVLLKLDFLSLESDWNTMTNDSLESQLS